MVTFDRMVWLRFFQTPPHPHPRGRFYPVHAYFFPVFTQCTLHLGPRSHSKAPLESRQREQGTESES